MKLALAVCALATLLLAGCSGGGGGSDGVEPAKDDQGRYKVQMPAGNVFSPVVAKVPVGATVVWVNTVAVAHDVNAADDSFSSDKALGHKMGQGEEFAHTFTAAGDYPYVCEIHASTGMKGTIRVVAADAAA